LKDLTDIAQIVHTSSMVKKKEVPVAEVKPPEVVPEVRLEAVVEQPQTATTTAPVTTSSAAVSPTVEPQVKPPELGASIDNLAKIVDSSSSQPQVPAAVEVTSGSDDKKGYLWLVVSFLLGLGLGIGVGYLVWGRTVNKAAPANSKVNETIPTQAPQVSPTAAPAVATPAPASSLKKSLLKLEVLNGTGGKGVAAKAKELLMKAGYTSVVAGNSDRDNVALTEVSIKASKNAYLDELKKDLSTQYTATETAVLAESSEFDAIVTIGLK
jgi:hypothetical protein